MIRQSWNPGVVTDGTGMPLVGGRVTVYDHDTNLPAQVWTLEQDDQYVPAQNPQFLNDRGMLDATLFMEVGIFDIRIESDNGDGTYAAFEDFDYGIDVNIEDAGRTQVDTVSDLMDLDPSVSGNIVTVLETPTRNYIWDGNSVDTPDGGVIVDSNVEGQGNWLLLWEGDSLPCTVYGVTPDNTSNLTALLNYSSRIGSIGIATPQRVRFVYGNYPIGTDYVTSKGLAFDAGAKLISGSITTPVDIVRTGAGEYVGDIYYSSKRTIAHSSDYRTVSAFWRSGAGRLVIDRNNYFTDDTIGTSIEVSGAIIEGYYRLPQLYVNGAYLKLNGCTIQGKTIFSPTVDYIRFANCAFNQEWFTSAGYSQWSFGAVPGAHIQVSSTDGVSCPWHNFSSTSVYWKALTSRGETEFDGHGGTVQPVQNSTFTTIRNCTFGSYLNDNCCSLFENVTVTSGLSFQGTGRAVKMKNCSFALSGNSMKVPVATLEDCNVRPGGDWYPDVTAIVVNGGKWEAGIALSATAQANRTHNQAVRFTDVDIDVGGNSFHLNDIEMTRCKSNAHVYLVPWNDSGTFRSHGYFRNNWFHQGSLIDINVKDPAAEWDVQDVVLDLLFMDNVFAQSDSRGIAIPFLTGLYDVTKHYVSLYSQGIYTGNTGNCPDEKSTRYYRQDSMDQEYNLQGSIKMYYQGHTYDKRVWNLTPQNDWTHGDLGIEFEPSSDSWNMINGRDAKAWYDRLLHVAYRNPVDAYNDQFLCVHACESNDGYDTDNIVMLF